MTFGAWEVCNAFPCFCYCVDYVVFKLTWETSRGIGRLDKKFGVVRVASHQEQKLRSRRFFEFSGVLITRQYVAAFTSSPIQYKTMGLFKLWLDFNFMHCACVLGPRARACFIISAWEAAFAVWVPTSGIFVYGAFRCLGLVLCTFWRELSSGPLHERDSTTMRSGLLVLGCVVSALLGVTGK